jgi:anti-repressor protein
MSAVEKKELIKILKTDIGAEELNSVNSRELYGFLGLAKGQYSRWIKAAIEKYDFEEKEDFVCIDIHVEGTMASTYIVTLDMAKELCMISNTPKGKQVRKYFIEVEKEASKPLTVEQLLLENAKMIENLQTKVITLEDKVEEDVPKVLFADSVSESSTAILIGEFAKAISNDTFKIGQNKLYIWLRENGYLIASGARKNQPKQQYIENRYFEVIERTITQSNGSTRITLTTKIKGKGQVALTKKIRESFKRLKI